MSEVSSPPSDSSSGEFPANADDLPIDDLESLLKDYPADVRSIFGPALTLFAGPTASTTDDGEKLRQLEAMIMRDPAGDASQS